MADVGRRFDRVTTHVTRELVADYRRALGQTGTAGDGAEAPAPSTLASVYTYGVIAQLASTRGAILAGQRFRFYRRPRIGDVLHTDAFVAESYTKRGRRYMELEMNTRDASGALVCRSRLTRILPAEEGPL